MSLQNDLYLLNAYFNKSKLEGISKVFFSPDGIYNQIGINTLLNPESGGFSIDELYIQVVTNTKDLLSFGSETPKTSSEKKAFIFGFPNYNKGVIETEFASADNKEEAEARGVRGPSRGGTRGERGTRGMRGGLSRGIRGNLQRYVDSNDLLALLPGTKKEVDLISALYEKNDGEQVTYLENDAIETNLKNVQSPHTLHIATHGFFLENEEDPTADISNDSYVQNPLLRSGLILAGANSFLYSGEFLQGEDAGQDGIFTAYEAMNMNLENTELVIMSACETGLGEVSNGEGVYGLQRSFQIAGAKSIIMSLWSVDDAATQELMTNFYELWLTTGDKTGSFIGAQKKLREKYPEPYFWGAFVMVGE